MKRIFCILLIALLCAGFTACGSDSDSETTASDNPSTADTVADEKATSDSVSANEPQYADIDAYLQAEYDESATEAEDSPITMDVYAEDDTLVYDYTYKKTYSEEEIEQIKSSLNSQLDENSYAFESLANDLDSKVAVENPKIKIVYHNGDGTVITERTFESADKPA